MNAAVSKYIDSKSETIIELETLLTSIPALAPEYGGDGEFQKAKALENWLHSKGFTDFEYINIPDNRVSSGIRPNLILTVPGKRADRNFWIISHLDIVPPGDIDKWNSDPYKVVVKNGRIYGRGVEDDQSGIVISVIAALALKELNITPEYTLKLMFVADEEFGSNYGLDYIIKKQPYLFNKNDLYLTPDRGTPTGDYIQIGEKSVLWLKFTVEGKTCHGSTPDLGKNSLVASSRLVLNLADLQNEFKAFQDELFDPPYSTFAPTKHEENIKNINAIPDKDIFYMDCRILPSMDLELVHRRINDICVEVEQKYGVRITISPVQNISSKLVSKDCEAVKKLSAAIEDVTGKKAKVHGVGGATVSAFLRNIDINALVWLTIDNTLHNPNENISIANLINDSKVIAQMMLG